MERWSFIKDYEDYMISDEGRIMSLKRPNHPLIMHQFRNHDGYWQVQLRMRGGHKDFLVHTLVAKAFVPNPKGLPEVNHIDEDKSNSHYTNLEWCTRKHNMNHGTIRERTRATRKRNNKQLPRGHNKPKACYCLETGDEFRTLHEAGRAFGVAGPAISKSCRLGWTVSGKYHFKYLKDMHK